MMRDDARHWNVPEPLAVREARSFDDASIMLRRHGNPQGPRLVLSHRNDLCADLYFPFWSLLTDRFDLVLYDFRNHGWNPVGDLRAHHFDTFVRDNQEVLRAIDVHFGKKPKIGVFHSVSATTAVLQAMQGDGFSALVLFDPPIRASQHLKEVASDLAQAARKRRGRFKTQEEVTALIRRAPAFSRLLPGVADLIARTVLRRVSDGETEYELRCPSAYEAQILDQYYEATTSVDVGRLSCPTKVIGADPAVPFSFLPSVDLGDLEALDYDFIPETIHFLQLEQPQACLVQMLDFLGNVDM